MDSNKNMVNRTATHCLEFVKVISPRFRQKNIVSHTYSPSWCNFGTLCSW